MSSVIPPLDIVSELCKQAEPVLMPVKAFIHQLGIEVTQFEVTIQNPAGKQLSDSVCSM